jgi:hypothetical protein
MLTGSIVSSIQGEPRLSHDIDVIINGTNRILNILRDHFNETSYYCDEDTILAKMLWAKNSGGSEKQRADVRRVYEVNAQTTDRVYIEKWCAVLGVKEYWDKISGVPT